jgi:glycerate dehydrogenase
LDVVEKEPIAADHPLLQVKQKNKLLITPHIAWSSIEARTSLMKQVYENMKEFLETGK